MWAPNRDKSCATRTTAWRCPSLGSASGVERRCGSSRRPTPTHPQCGRVILKDGLWVAEGVKDYGGGQVFHVVAIVELHDGKM
jgi:hypothetical protein